MSGDAGSVLEPHHLKPFSSAGIMVVVVARSAADALP
jgi:hypothetical protein